MSGMTKERIEEDALWRKWVYKHSFSIILPRYLHLFCQIENPRINFQSLPIKPCLRNSLIGFPCYAFPPPHPLPEEAAWNTGYWAFNSSFEILFWHVITKWLWLSASLFKNMYTKIKTIMGQLQKGQKSACFSKYVYVLFFYYASCITLLDNQKIVLPDD